MAILRAVANSLVREIKRAQPLKCWLISFEAMLHFLLSAIQSRERKLN